VLLGSGGATGRQGWGRDRRAQGSPLYDYQSLRFAGLVEAPVKRVACRGRSALVFNAMYVVSLARICGPLPPAAASSGGVPTLEPGHRGLRYSLGGQGGVYSDRRVYAGGHPCPVGIRWAGCKLGHPPGARKARQAEVERFGSCRQAAHAGCRENMCGSHVNAHFRQPSSCAPSTTNSGHQQARAAYSSAASSRVHMPPPTRLALQPPVTATTYHCHPAPMR
jgi:hypothetical protein